MNRPSLLSGTPPSGTGATASSRILADMEGRAAERVSPARAVARRSPWLLPALVITLVLTSLAAWWWSRGDSPQDADALGISAPLIQNPTPSDAPLPAANAAVIIDEAAPESATPLPETTPVTVNEPLSQGASEPALAAAPAARRAPTSSRAAPNRKLGAREEEDLFGTLIGIIKQKPAAEQKPESMDALIARIQADQNRTEVANKAAFDSIDQSASTQSSIQAQLSRCPAANTTQGIACRRKICASKAGKDPACPAR